MRKGSYSVALLGVAMVSGGVSSAVTVKLAPPRVVVVRAAPVVHDQRAVVRPAPASAAPRLKIPRVDLHAAAASQAKAVHLKPKPVVTRKAAAAPKAAPARPRTTPSLYERTTSPKVLRDQGCRAGLVRTYGLVILDFGKPAYYHH